MVIRSKMPTTFWKSSEIRRSLTHPSMCLGSHVSDTKFCLQSPRTVCRIGPRDFLRALSGAQTVPAMRTSLGSPTTRRNTGKTQGKHRAATLRQALAVGEMSQRTGIRPWAAAWGKFSQQDANSEALRISSQRSANLIMAYICLYKCQI